MARVKSYTNGPGASGTVFPTDLNAIQDDYEGGFGSYKNIAFMGYGGALAQAAGTYVLSATPAQSGVIPAGNSGAVAPVYSFHFDPADHPGAPRTLKLRVRAEIWTNAVSPAATFTTGLYPVSAYAGASGAQPIVNTLGAVVAGSTVAQTPGAGPAGLRNNSTDFTAPAAGFYALGIVISVLTAANAAVFFRAALQFRQV